MIYNCIGEEERFASRVFLPWETVSCRSWCNLPVRDARICCASPRNGFISRCAANTAAWSCGPSRRLPSAKRKDQVRTAPPAEPAAPTANITSAAPLAVPVDAAANSSPFADLRQRGRDTASASTPARTSKRRRMERAGSRLRGFSHYRLFIYLGPSRRLLADRREASSRTRARNRYRADRQGGHEIPSRRQASHPAKKAAPQDPVKNPPRRSLQGTRPEGSYEANARSEQCLSAPPLIISIHDYLYANPIQNGMPGSNAHNLNNLLDGLNLGLHIPLNQIAHLSDDASAQVWSTRTDEDRHRANLTKFLDTSRPQDRIMVFFIGHSVELEDNVYLAPIEGELDRAESLIPLQWFYEQMAKCKARQKVLVLDVNRFHRTFGQERPGGKEMGPKLDALLKAPPAGVQVWSSCSVKQRSYATDDFPMGIFLDSLLTALQQGGNGRIQKGEDALPLDLYVDLVNQLMKDDLSKRKLEQVSRLSGKEADSDAAYDARQPPHPMPSACLAPPPAGVEMNKMLVESVLDQIGTPPIKVTHEMALRYDALPPFPVEALKKYEGGESNPDSPLRKAVKNARAVLWAIYPGEEPKELKRARSASCEDRFASSSTSSRRAIVHRRRRQRRDAVQGAASRTTNASVALIMRRHRGRLGGVAGPEGGRGAGRREQTLEGQLRFRAGPDCSWSTLICSSISRCSAPCARSFRRAMRTCTDGWKLASQSKLQGDSTGKKFAKDRPEAARQDRQGKRRLAVGSAGQAREAHQPRPRMATRQIAASGERGV